ncbi:Stk1 family PASTA domain-containing Ser/Thr kinase [Krasilnikovia sp. M28-CT-15]|uniref:Stk1 family PASTA domain-containing Ser/Thr kinase n=1 Tax=Krasilnikovia sp. M28-CT-15 TaxID=3373540 RepID=UPI00399CDDED
MDTTVADTLIGTTIDGRYRITGRVARGGMATVYTATDERLERTVALKIIHPSQATNVHFVDRFTDEAKTIARLTHPNVVAVYDQGRHQGLPYLVMEYVQGRTLRDLLTQRRRLNPVEACAILEQMLAAIAAAHRAGLVHRDVKPENVLVAEAPSGGIANLVDSVVKVADFGLARAVEASATEDSSQLMATVAYVAPELVTDGHADARTDVYSAGIVLFEMLTGRVPFDGAEPVEVAWQHVDNDVPAPSTLVKGLPGTLDDLIARATRRDPGGRPTDAGAMLAEVQVVRDDLGAANVETALLRQVPARPREADATALVPAITTAMPAVQDRPAWARLPQPSARAQRRRAPAAPGPYGPAAPGPYGPAAFGPSSPGRFGDRRRIALMAAVALMVFTVLGSTWWVTLGRYVDAPQLVSMTKAQAEAYAQREGLTVSYGDGAYSETVGKDVVLSQRPAATERVIRGGEITLSLSLGPERYPVPDVIGTELAAAKGELEAVKLKVKEDDGQFSDTVPQGAVVATDPKAGTSLKPGDTVTVSVSKGKAPITVPNVVGSNINAARDQLQRLGLTVVEEYKDSNEPADNVIGQSLKAGAGAQKDDEIKLDVSKGPPLVTVPRVVDLPCTQAQQQLQDLGLQPQVGGINPNGTVRIQNPPENTQIAPRSGVAIQCF